MSIRDFFSRKPEKKTRNTDGLTNIFTGLGTRADRVNQTRATRSRKLTWDELDSLYRSNAMCKKVIDLVAGEMTREWFEIDGDQDKIVLTRMEEMGCQAVIKEAITWARLYGGSIVVIGADDGGELTDELNLDNLKKVTFLSVFDRTCIQNNYADLYQNPADPKYGQPEFYFVIPPSTGIPFKVHESRVLRFEGEPVPKRMRTEYEGWGMPTLEPGYRQIVQLESTSASISSLLEDFVQNIIKIDNLAGRVATREGEEEVMNRLMTLDYGKHSSRTIMLDKEHEDYEKVSINVAGLAELLKKKQISFAAAFSYPYILLMGDSPSGLQSTGQSDVRMHYDNISKKQENELKPQLEKLVKIFMREQEGETNGKEIENWHIVFNPLWQLEKTEEAEYKYKIAQTDAIYIDKGVLDPEEVADSRFGGDSYNAETILSNLRDADA